MKSIFEYLNNKPKWLLLIWGVMLIGFLGVIDFITGDFSLTLFYLIPIFIGAWFVNKWAGLMMGLLSGLAIFVSSEMPPIFSYDPLALRYWNSTMEVLFLIIMNSMFSRLKRDFETEKSLARQDSLTGALNRRSFLELAEYEIKESFRYQRVLSVAYIDLDNFKAINDSMGHHAGDNLLVKVVQVLIQNLRSTDLVARLGGDEFCILFPETASDVATIMLNKLQGLLFATMAANSWPVTFSIGAITYKSLPSSADAMLREVDKRMYAVKQDGKNRISHSTVESPAT
jgi:diguanylate cyclase (GGDEF)-like protein